MSLSPCVLLVSTRPSHRHLSFRRARSLSPITKNPHHRMHRAIQNHHHQADSAAPLCAWSMGARWPGHKAHPTDAAVAKEPARKTRRRMQGYHSPTAPSGAAVPSVGSARERGVESSRAGGCLVLHKAVQPLHIAKHSHPWPASPPPAQPPPTRSRPSRPSPIRWPSKPAQHVFPSPNRVPPPEPDQNTPTRRSTSISPVSRDSSLSFPLV